jgi:hypothetical protein
MSRRGLEFEPIHRVLFGLARLFAALRDTWPNFIYTPVASAEDRIR